ncbi:Uncharacterised protein [Candidatus Venteria ishoeyi]|uniref:Uncharacterized protein n=1 Tax=Candidatus Venteria ishoeyi TaxID=1899563 RepID=A0A1H6F4Z7_9GAMM|nr:Uncharacterised protein [Candidatus Venteria ishoeyi]
MGDKKPEPKPIPEPPVPELAPTPLKGKTLEELIMEDEKEETTHPSSVSPESTALESTPELLPAPSTETTLEKLIMED